MEYFSDFNDIVYHTVSNVFYTFIQEGTPSDPDRYKFLVPKTIPAVGEVPEQKQNLGIYYKFLKKQKNIRYQILYNLTTFIKDRNKVDGVTHSVSLTLDLLDKGLWNGSDYSQENADKSSFMAEIANQLRYPQFWQETIDLMTDKQNFGTPEWTGTLKRDYIVKSLDIFNVGSVKVDDSWKDILNINITFTNLGELN